MLQFPHQRQPGVVEPLTPYPKLFAVFEQASDWLDRLGTRSAGALNDAIAGDRIREVSLVGEALHEAGIAQIASRIAETRGRIRVVFIAGPSSSGKTTFSKRLAVQLLANGIRPMPLALDDYFVDRDADAARREGRVRLRDDPRARSRPVRRAPAIAHRRAADRRCRATTS